MRSVALAVLLLLAGNLGAQVTESITVTYVEVPVTVVDRNGDAMRGLTKANFEIFDDGKKREIAGFEAVDYAVRAEAPAATPPPPITPAARRNFLLLFDLTFSSPSSMVRAKAAAREFATKMMNPDDRVAVATIDVAHGFRLLTAFTTDRSVVDAAIANPEGFTTLDPLQLAGTHLDEDVATSMNDAGRSGLGQDINAEQIREINRVEDSYSREKVNSHVTLLAGLAGVLRGVRGQKHILLLSEGFDPRLIQGRDAGSDETQNKKEQKAIESGEIWSVDTDNRYGSSSSMALVNGLAEVAKRSDVIVDALDIRGVRAGSDVRGSLRHDTSSGPEFASPTLGSQSNEALHLIALSTGGTVFQNANNLADDFHRALKAQDVVYVLAFQAPSGAQRRFHTLKVKLVNVPGGRATARSGYYEGGPGSTAERALSTAEIIVDDIAQSDVHVAAVAAPFATTGPKAEVAVVAEINGKDLLAASGNAAALEIYTYAFDAQGNVRDSKVRRVSLDAAKLGAKLARGGVKYYETLSLPPGAYSIKTLVRVADSDKKGFVRTDVVVPDKGALAMSPPLFLDNREDWVLIRAASSDAVYPFRVGDGDFVPSAAVRIGNGERRRFVVFVQNATPDELTIVTNPEATPVSRFRTANGATFVFELAHAAPTLNVTATKRSSAERLTVTTSIAQ
jgi:VWFA-related protein